MREESERAAHEVAYYYCLAGGTSLDLLTNSIEAAIIPTAIGFCFKNSWEGGERRNHHASLMSMKVSQWECWLLSHPHHWKVQV